MMSSNLIRSIRDDLEGSRSSQHGASRLSAAFWIARTSFFGTFLISSCPQRQATPMGRLLALGLMSLSLNSNFHACSTPTGVDRRTCAIEKCQEGLVCECSAETLTILLAGDDSTDCGVLRYADVPSYDRAMACIHSALIRTRPFRVRWWDSHSANDGESHFLIRAHGPDHAQYVRCSEFDRDWTCP